MMPKAKSFALFVLTILFVFCAGPANTPGTIRLVDSFQTMLAARLPVAELTEGMSPGELQQFKSLGYIQ